MLSNLRKTLNVSDEEHEQIVTELSGSSASAAPGQPLQEASGRYTQDKDFEPTGYGAQSPAAETPVKEEPAAAPEINEGITRVTPSPAPAAAPQTPAATAPQTPAPAAAPAAAVGDSPLEQGKEAFRQGDYQKAYDLCDEALKAKPGDSQALFFKKRAKSKLDESGGGSSSPAPEGTADPMMSHVQQTAQTPAPASGGDQMKCMSCRDTHNCSWCKSSGVCWMCHGAGTCSSCKGSGLTDGGTCTKCKGSGKCDSCLGSGKCYWCKGSGKCHKCSL
jgi:hypothetical protein